MRTRGTRLCAVLAALLLGSAAAAPALALSSGDDRIRIETEATPKAGVASLDIRCPIRGARIYIDSSYAGTAPLSRDVAAGIHYVVIEAPGCYPLGLELPFAEKTLYRISFDPARPKGRLFVSLAPASATLYLDGEPIDPGLTELPAGTYTLVARRFGYREERRSVEISEGFTTSADIALERAPFEVTGFRATRASFNPANAGASGRTGLAFDATSYGSARIEILGPDGAAVRVIDIPRIAAWRQSAAWDGRADDGSPLPDGSYTARLTAAPDPDLPAAPGGGPAAGGAIVLETEVRIDSSIIVRATGSVSAMPGLLAFPDPLPQPAGATALEAAWFLPRLDAPSSGVGLSLSTSIGGAVTLSCSGAAELGGGGAADLAASVLVSLLADRASGTGGAILLRGSWTSAPEAAMPESRTAVEASIPWSLGIGALRIGAAPGASLDLSSSPELLALARVGLWIDSGPLRAGLSGVLGFGLGLGGGDAGPSWPARIAAEARLMLGSSPLALSAYALADISPGFELRPTAGFGIGLLF